ncbi:hypothetical protein FHW84_000103 [Dyella sp. SG562]|nr:hypothetical protein [Dyella sp. SG562]NKJ22942.1 hypothetical protein [Dyella sp. SG609]
MSFHVIHRQLPSRDRRGALPCVRTKEGRFIHTD